ncbi:MAG: uracil-DNA glycosylase [Alphaproteobacteria bacterium]|nr:uracil-DNA glycosylase [Alphaproteobacteria bacterium]
MNVKIEESWKNVLHAEFEKPYFKSLTDFVRAEYLSGKEIYPAPANIFNAFRLCPFDSVCVVIIGQDPYHNPGQAHGLSFSVPNGVPAPPSLKNIFKEIGRTEDTDLSRWAEQGVLLLNSVLTVPENIPGGHAGKGWEEFTDSVIEKLAEQKDGIVYILWGNYAIKKAAKICPEKNLILTSVHPSPLSAHRGFFGCGHFDKTNQYLLSKGTEPIKW